MRLDLSPWARRDVDPVVQEIMRTMEPRSGTAHIGRGREHWRAFSTLNGYVLADVTAGTANDAAERLIERMSEPDGMDAAKAREFVEWRGTEVEVVD